MKSVPQIDNANFSYPCGDFRLFRVTPTDPDSMRFLPKLHVRALEFLEKYGAETDPLFISQLFYQTFKNPQTQNLVHLIVAVNVHDAIVSHGISYIENYQRLGPVVVQMQAEKDGCVDPVSGDAIRKACLSLIEEWALSLKVKTIIAYALTPARARLERRDGFKPYRVVLRKDLEG